MRLLEHLHQRWRGEPAGTEDRRPRFIAEALLIGAAAAFGMGGVYVAMRLPVTASLACTVALALCALALLLRRGADSAQVARTALVVLLISFTGFVLTESPFDPTMYLWFGITPLMATATLGEAAGRRWALATLVVAVASRAVVGLQWVTPSEVHANSFVAEARALGLGLTLFLVIQRFDAERRVAVRAARAADEVKGRFLANMSHEIRTPLNGILGMTQALLRGPLEAGLRETLEVVSRSGLTLVGLLNDLLDVSKIEAGKLVLSRHPFVVGTTVHDVIALFRPLAAEKGVALELSLADDVPLSLEGDAHRLEQVLRNLVGNAVKFTSRGTVRLAVSRVAANPPRFCFEVSDTGIGISQSALPRLFRPFEQADERSRLGGTGLGLALSQSLVELMGGKLQVDTRLGAGSRFWFELGLSLPDEPATAVADVPVRHLPFRGSADSRLEGRSANSRLEGNPADSRLEGNPADSRLEGNSKVLVVDDNAINLLVASALVKRAGFETEAACSGRQAIDAVASGHFLLVLMDCHMPDVDGLEATREIRALKTGAATTRIVALTASAMPDELRACVEAGMDDTLVKPLMFDELVRVLEDAQRLQPGVATPARLTATTP